MDLELRIGGLTCDDCAQAVSRVHVGCVPSRILLRGAHARPHAGQSSLAQAFTKDVQRLSRCAG